MKEPITFASTFITGFSELIPNALVNALPSKKIEILSLFDGLIVFKTDAAIKDVIGLPFFNNTYLMLAEFATSQDIKNILDTLNTSFNFHLGLKVKLPKDIRSFRLVISHANKTINPHPQYKARVEAKIAKDLKLRIDPKRPDTEFWLISRSEGYSFFGMRLTHHPDYATSLPKGALRPELAYLITNLIPIAHDGILLDPFAGSGMLAEAAVRTGWNTVYASDFSLKRVQILKSRVRKYRNITVLQQDALDMRTIKKESIDAIITNPPWGTHFVIDVKTFYPQFFREAYRVLKPNTYLTVLVENTHDTHIVLKQIIGFEKEQAYNTLVSGRKAQIWVMKRLSNDNNTRRKI